MSNVKKIITDETFLSQKSIDVNPTGTVSATGLSRDPRIPVSQIIDELIATAKANEDNCAGLAANQIGYLVRIFVMRLNGLGWFPIINPVIKGKSTARCQKVEYCLSRPGKPGIRVKRHKQVTVEFTFINEDGEPEIIMQKCEGFSARVVQHEIDHLKGKLI